MLKKPFKKIIFWAIAPTGVGLSGGDRIFIEFAKRWSKHVPLTIYISEAGLVMANKLGLNDQVDLEVLTSPIQNFVFHYLWKIYSAISLSLNLRIDSPTLIYSTSEFWMDSLPACILRLRYPTLVTWVAAWYQTAPNPITGFHGGRYRLSALWYWLAQLPIKPLIKKSADYVLVNNQLETTQFKNAIVVLGAVSLTQIDEWISKNSKEDKAYAAVFQGRFHPQKGVVEMIEIWKLVAEKISTARLVMIGDGPLMPQVKKRIQDLKLSKKITLLGYVFDGDKKYRTFSQSKIVVHPALFDSGGMASAEAMAFGLPCVGFNLTSYQDYYPAGMLKVEVGDKPAFAAAIINLLTDSKLRRNLGNQARQMIKSSWSWDSRAEQIYRLIHTL